MKITPGTNRKKDEKSASFTKTTSGQPEKKANDLKIPKSVVENPGKHNLQVTVRPIHNGYIAQHSYHHPDHGHVSHEVYHASNPLAKEGAGEEKNAFGEVGGLD